MNRENKNLFFIKVLPFNFKNQPTTIHKNSEFSGNKMFDEAKSSELKIVLPNIAKSFKMPKDSVAGMAIKLTIIKIKILAFKRDILNCSMNVAVGTSKILMPEVKAAKSKSTKNAIATQFPKGIWAKIFGKVTKTKPAPEFGSSPNEKTAGNIIIPASSANNVSEKIIVYADFVIFLSSFM